jgi:hypothetical protein
LASSVFTALGDGSVGALPSQCSRVELTAGSTTSSRSSSAASVGVASRIGATLSQVSACAAARAAATRSSSTTTPGRITFAELRYSHASRNSSDGASCSIPRASRNSSSSLSSNALAGRQPR